MGKGKRIDREMRERGRAERGGGERRRKEEGKRRREERGRGRI